MRFSAFTIVKEPMASYKVAKGDEVVTLKYGIWTCQVTDIIISTAELTARIRKEYTKYIGCLLPHFEN